VRGTAGDSNSEEKQIQALATQCSNGDHPPKRDTDAVGDAHSMSKVSSSRSDFPHCLQHMRCNSMMSVTAYLAGSLNSISFRQTPSTQHDIDQRAQSLAS
jgi:hypothetical protein